MMDQIFRPHTLDLQDIRGASLLRGLKSFFLFLTIVVVIVEVAARVLPPGILPPPSTGADNFQFDAKVYYLESQFRRYGRLDCIILGSSVANDGIEPSAIEQAYREKTGLEIHCFNFGLPTLGLDTASPVLEALIQRFNPRLIVYIITARDFRVSLGEPSRPLQKTLWVEYNRGRVTPPGWLVNYSYAYRYYLLLKYELVPDNRALIANAYGNISPSGFSPLHSLRPDPIDAQWGFRNFAFNKVAWAGFEHVVSMTDANTGFVFVEAPVEASYLPLYFENDPNLYEREFIAPLQDYLTIRQIPFLRTRLFSTNIPASQWYDPIHLNSEGARKFSEWLAWNIVDLLGTAPFQ